MSHRHFNIASISVGAERGGSACACAGTAGCRRVSIVSRSMGAERGGDACASTAGSRRFVSRSVVQSEAAVPVPVRPEAGVSDIFIYRHGLRCRTGSALLESDNSRIYGFGEPIISGCIQNVWVVVLLSAHIQIFVNPDHMHRSQLSHHYPDKIILSHGHQIVAVREPTITRL